MEINRRWHEPVVEIYSNLITPTVCCAASAYDLANRRWYRLEVDVVVQNDDWLSSTVAKHISEHYATTKKLPPWNTIKTSPRGTPVEFETMPDRRVDREITLSLSYGSDPTNILPTTPFDELKDLFYISRSADRCTWQSKDCVFKRIEFDVDIEVMEDEIRIRETLIKTMGPNVEDVNEEIMNRFLITPLLAVVIGHSEPWKPGTVAGILMPFVGQDLEILFRGTSTTLPITELHLRELIRGVHDLGKCGIQHGDIKYWNTSLYRDKYGPAKLMLIDIGSEAPDYDGDAKALGELLLWCLEHASTLHANTSTRERIEAAAKALSNEDFEAALAALPENS